MSLSVQYETLAEAEMRLNSTIVMYDGEPVYISRVIDAAPGDPKPDVFRVYAQPLPVREVNNREEFRKFISSKKFDLRTIKMGFMNYRNGEVYYCLRKPMRQFKQGVSQNTLICTSVSNPGAGDRINFGMLLSLPEFVDCIKGKYPSFEEAMHRVKTGELNACAFSRNYALIGDGELDGLVYLYHKEDKVGFIMDGKISIPDKMRCLRESLVELGVNVQ